MLEAYARPDQLKQSKHALWLAAGCIVADIHIFRLPIVMAALQYWCTAQAQYMFRHV